MKKNVLLFVLLFVNIVSFAQGSYIYVEPIKGIPCKMILNQKEVPLMTKNYFLITIDHTGEQTLDIVFGNNVYPSQTFVVDVVEGSAYGYKLSKTAEDKFYLLDIVNNGKIIETNTAVNIGLTTNDNVINFYNTNTVPVVTQEPILSKKAQKQKNKELEKINHVVQKTTNTANGVKDEKQEYGIVEIITSKEPTKNTNENAKSPETKSTNCTLITSEMEVKNIIERLVLKSDDESKLILVKKKTFTGCLTMNQIYSITDQFNTQYGRFAVVKFFRPLMSDVENIILLEPLFKTEGYKTKLREL